MAVVERADPCCHSVSGYQILDYWYDQATNTTHTLAVLSLDGLRLEQRAEVRKVGLWHHRSAGASTGWGSAHLFRYRIGFIPG